MKGKIKNSWIYKNNWIFLFIIIGIIGIIGYTNSNNIKNNGLYTIGHVYRTEGTRGGVMVYLKYYYKGKEFMGKYIGNGENIHRIKMYYVQFLQNNPKKYVILDEVPDCIDEAPYYGWKTLPKCWGEEAD